MEAWFLVPLFSHCLLQPAAIATNNSYLDEREGIQIRIYVCLLAGVSITLSLFLTLNMAKVDQICVLSTFLF